MFYNNTWTDPIKMNSLNTSKSEVSLTYDYNSTKFLLSATSEPSTIIESSSVIGQSSAYLNFF